MTLRLNRLKTTDVIVDEKGRASTTFVLWWQNVVGRIEESINANSDAIDLINAANDAIDAANVAIDTANIAIESANDAIETTAASSSLANSYIFPEVVLSASTTTITVSAHTRFYADGTSVAVSGDTVPTTGGSGAIDYVSYVQPSRGGGAVTYLASTTQPTQLGDVHVVGAVTVPAVGTQAGGSGPRRPGEVEP